VGCAIARPTATPTGPPPQSAIPAPRRGPIGWIVAGSLVVGAAAAAVLVWFAFAGAREHVITGAALLGFALGWALLALMSARWTRQPQRWALVPAAVLAVISVALLLLAPGASLTTGGYWYHQRLQKLHPAVHDQHFQDLLLDSLARFTGTTLT
jgi:peptidoglycan/LPS O-acetylase OafA/YrhL